MIDIIELIQLIPNQIKKFIQLIKDEAISYFCYFIQFITVSTYSVFMLLHIQRYDSAFIVFMNGFFPGLFVAMIYCGAGAYALNSKLDQIKSELKYLELAKVDKIDV